MMMLMNAFRWLNQAREAGYTLPHLALDGKRLTFPKHHWAFGIDSGDCVEVANALARLEINRYRGQAQSAATGAVTVPL